MFSLLISLLRFFLHSLYLCSSAYFFITSLSSNARLQTLKYFKLSLQYSLSLWCDDSFNLTTVFSEPELFLTLSASCVLLLYMFLGHLIFWEAAGSCTTVRLQHLMYQVLSPWQFHSKSKLCFGENNVFMQEKSQSKGFKVVSFIWKEHNISS